MPKKIDTTTEIKEDKVVQPSVEQPPVEQPPVEQPPVEQPPVEQSLTKAERIKKAAQAELYLWKQAALDRTPEVEEAEE